MSSTVHASESDQDRTVSAKALPATSNMRLVRSQYEAHHRGYRIVAETAGGSMLLYVTPTRAGLPRLPWSRFRTIKAPWAKAVLDVARYIDQALARFIPFA